MKECFLINIESAMEFRERKAVEYPHDLRNSESAAALGGLLRYAESLPEDHPIFTHHQHLDYTACLSQTSRINADLARYGFDGPEDPAAFVERLLRDVGNTPPTI